MRRIAPLLLVSGLAAQTPFVVPSKATLAAPGAVWSDAAVQPFVLWATTGTDSAARVQYLYDVTDIAAPVATLAGLRMRPPHDQQLATGGTFTTSITLSTGPLAPSQASPTFAANHGANALTVFTGAINVPGFGAQPWPSSWFATVAFSQPFAYARAAGQSLVVEFRTTASTATRFTGLEGYRIEGGRLDFEVFDSDCFNSSGQAPGGVGWDPVSLIPGGSISIDWSGAPPATPLYAANVVLWSARGVGGAFGPLFAPFPISALGVPANPGCDLAVGAPLTTSVGTYRDWGNSFASLQVRGVAIPANPNLAGAWIHTQPVGLDLVNGVPSFFPLQAARWTVGTGIRVPVAEVRSTYDPNGSAPATGTVLDSEGVTLELL